MEEAATTVPMYTPPTAVITGPARILPGITIPGQPLAITCRHRAITHRCQVIVPQAGGAVAHQVGAAGVLARGLDGVGLDPVAQITGRRATGVTGMAVITAAMAATEGMAGVVAAGMGQGGARVALQHGGRRSWPLG